MYDEGQLVHSSFTKNSIIYDKAFSKVAQSTMVEGIHLIGGHYFLISIGLKVGLSLTAYKVYNIFNKVNLFSLQIENGEKTMFLSRQNLEF